MSLWTTPAQPLPWSAEDRERLTAILVEHADELRLLVEPEPAPLTRPVTWADLMEPVP